MHEHAPHGACLFPTRPRGGTCICALPELGIKVAHELYRPLCLANTSACSVATKSVFSRADSTIDGLKYTKPIWHACSFTLPRGSVRCYPRNVHVSASDFLIARVGSGINALLFFTVTLTVPV
jgi:hypothetical protein